MQLSATCLACTSPSLARWRNPRWHTNCHAGLKCILPQRKVGCGEKLMLVSLHCRVANAIHTHHFLPSCIFRPNAGTQLSHLRKWFCIISTIHRLLWSSEAIVAIGRFSNVPSSSLPTGSAARSEILKPSLEARSMYSLLASEMFGWIKVTSG